jgi:DNA polymerase-3 subunit epsilon
MGRCLSPCLGDLDPNLYRRRLDEALRLFLGDGAVALVDHVDRQMRSAAGERRYERAAWLRRRLGRLRVIVRRLGGVLEATHARPRLLLVAHPADPARRDAFWLSGGRLVDWGALPDSAEEVHERMQAALRRGGRTGELGAHVPPDEIDEVRIVATYLASHPDVPQLALDPLPEPGALERFLRASVEGEADHLRGDLVAGRDGRAELGLAADERERDRAQPRRDGGARDLADLALAEPQRYAGLDRG